MKELKATGETTIEETATTFIKENIEKGICKPWLKENFQYNIFSRQIKLENGAQEKKLERVFVDRGILDSIVYLEISGKQNSKEYQSIKEQLNTLDIENRYAAIFFIEPHSKDGFKLEKNEIRRETTEEAIELATKIKAAYSKYYPITIIPGGMSPAERAALIQKQLKSL